MKRLLSLAIIALQFSCSIYSSTGRKDFESKAPNYVVSQALIGCEPVLADSYNQGFLESFERRSFYQDESYWVAQEKALPHFIQVLNLKEDDLCSYQFKSEEEWQALKSYFFAHLP